MRCHRCDYPLWAVEARACPECGDPFRPSEYEFALGAVRFECPHCRTAYFGTSPEGHLEPRAFECVGCHRSIEMDAMVVMPVGAVDVSSELIKPTIWEQPEHPGGWRWWMAARQLLFSPSTFGRLIRRTGPTGPAWRFAVRGWLVMWVLSLVLTVVVGGLGLDFSPVTRNASVSQRIVERLIALVVLFPTFAGWTVLTALIEHGIARALTERPGPLTATLQVKLYASGATSVLMAVGVVYPAHLVAFPLVVISQIAIAAILYRHVHRTTTGRGVVIAATFQLCLLGLCVGMVLLLAISFTMPAQSLLAQSLRAQSLQASLSWPSSLTSPFGARG
jgi:hypothetical protein